MVKFINDTIHSASQADFTKYVYEQLYTTSAITATINGNSVSLPAGIKLEMQIKSASTTAGLYLVGLPLITVNGGSNIGGSY